jgi:hypothetical protein
MSRSPILLITLKNNLEVNLRLALPEYEGFENRGLQAVASLSPNRRSLS